MRGASDLACVGVFSALYVAWATVFRSRIEPWVRRQVARRLGIEIVWVLASAFPVRVWTWGLARTAAATRERLDRALAMGSAFACFVGACLPLAPVQVILRCTELLSFRVANLFYLGSGPLLAVFVGSQLIRAEVAG